MTHGGPRKGAGRKKGSVSSVTAQRRQATRELVDAAKSEGETPLEYMLKVMRDRGADEKRRDMMAVAASPYMHPRLAAIDHTGDITVRTQDEAMDELEQAADAAEHAASVAHVTH